MPGRRKPFDELLAEHKARVNCEKEQQQNQALKLQEQAATQKALEATLKRSTSTVSDSSVTSSASSRFEGVFSFYTTEKALRILLENPSKLKITDYAIYPDSHQTKIYKNPSKHTY